MDLVRVQRQAREPDVVRLGDRPAEAARGKRRRRRSPRRSGRATPSGPPASQPSSRSSCSPPPEPSRPLDDRQVDHRRLQRDRAPPVPRRLLVAPRRPAAPTRAPPARARRRGSRSPPGGWMQALPREAERAREPGTRLEPARSREVEVDDVERRAGYRPRPSRSRASSARRGSRAASARGSSRSSAPEIDRPEDQRATRGDDAVS